MIQQAPGYNLTLNRRPARISTGRRMVQRPRQEESAAGFPTLRSLCGGIDILAAQGDLLCSISDICFDSRKVSPGALFFALPGDRMDGSSYIHDAIDRGAVAIMTEKSGLHHPCATFIQVADIYAAMNLIAKRFYNFSITSPALIGVAGSHGKTVVSHLLHHLLDHGEEPVGLFSSIHYNLGSRIVPSYRTTPEAIDLYGMLDQMKESRCRRAILEISSREIEKNNLNGLPLDVAVFLNHEAGSDLSILELGRFLAGESGVSAGAVVLNIDDPAGERLCSQIPSSKRVVTFGRNSLAEIRAVEVIEGDGGAIIQLQWPEGSARVRTRQLGSFAVSNLLAAVAASYAAGADLNAVLPRILSFEGAPGRFEEVRSTESFRIFVDAAKTPNAMRHALQAAREVCDRRVLAVFGSSGNIDSGRREEMTKIVQEESDFCWATADNPGNEPLDLIFNEMRGGVFDPDSIAFIDDRRRAIALALDRAGPGDVVVLLGKGEEAFQIIGDSARPFDDRLVARELLALREVALSAG